MVRSSTRSTRTTCAPRWPRASVPAWSSGKHALKNALSPAVTVIGIQFGYLLGGTLIIEQIFSLPGLGTYIIQAINDKDIPEIQGVVLVVATVLRPHQPRRRHRSTPTSTRRSACREELAMSTWSPPDAGDPFVGLTAIPETGDRPDELPERRPGFWVRFLHQRWAIAGLIFLLIVIVAAIFAPLVAPHPPDAQDINAVNAGPSLAHWLGTDDLGRDILSRLIWGARISLRAAFEIVGLAAVFAIPLGLIAGFFRGAVDTVIMRTMDALFSFPPLILALTVAALLGADVNDAAIAIAIVFIPGFVRLLRGEVIAVREEAYIESARSLGAHVQPTDRRGTSCPTWPRPIIIQLALVPRLRPAGRGRAELPRRRRAAAHPELGRHAARRVFSSSTPRRGRSSSPASPSC